MSRCVWALVDEDITEHIAATQIHNPKQWSFYMQETLSASELQKLLVICWAIWEARRKALKENIFQSPLSTFGFISKFLDDMTLTGFCDDSQSKQKTKSRQLAPKWIPPPEAFFKFNVDGALARSGDKGAVGVICRDRKGNYVAASVVVINGLLDPPSLEALACNEATSLAIDMGVGKCVIASDCLEVIMNIQKQNLYAYAAILNEIKARTTLF